MSRHGPWGGQGGNGGGAAAALACSGEIQLVMGPMFSGKSSELIRRIRRYQAAKKECLVIKAAKDTRYSEDCAATHDGTQLRALPCERLSQALPHIEKIDVVGVDEGHFFPDLVEFCEKAANQGKVVIVASLDGSYLREPFKEVMDLIPKAENVTKLTAVCASCAADAAFTLRKTTEKALHVVGGADKYQPMCRACYMKAVTS